MDHPHPPGFAERIESVAPSNASILEFFSAAGLSSLATFPFPPRSSQPSRQYPILLEQSLNRSATPHFGDELILDITLQFTKRSSVSSLAA